MVGEFPQDRGREEEDLGGSMAGTGSVEPGQCQRGSG